jgi:hypothetical protein
MKSSPKKLPTADEKGAFVPGKTLREAQEKPLEYRYMMVSITRLQRLLRAVEP